MNKSEVGSEELCELTAQGGIVKKALTIVVCDTCRIVIAQLGKDPLDGVMDLLNIRDHMGHDFITLNRTSGRYRKRCGLHLRTEYIQ